MNENLFSCQTKAGIKNRIICNFFVEILLLCKMQFLIDIRLKRKVEKIFFGYEIHQKVM